MPGNRRATHVKQGFDAEMKRMRYFLGGKAQGASNAESYSVSFFR